MIPILYSTSETSFTSNGLGRLTDCISCLVTEERNGIFECEFKYPITGKLYNEMVTNGGIISVTHDDAKDRQPFDIYKYSAPIDGIVTFNARHISYRLSGITVKPFTAASCALALQGIGTNSLSTNPFSFWTDKAVTSTFTLSVPTSAKAILAGQQGSILDVYGKGEYKFDKFDVKLYTNRGTNSGVTIRYGKNLSDTLVEKDNGEYYNAIVPYWKGEGGTLVTLTGWYVVQTGETLKYCVPVDFSSEFQSQPTELELQSKAAAYLANNTPWLPKENIKVDFVQLWNTDEYKNVSVLERVKLCDTVAIYYPALGLTNSSAKVIKVVYDTLLERYTSIELGEPQQTLAEAIMQPYAQAIASISDKASVSFMEEAIQAATDLIAGGLGGHVVINRNANGEPEEILIMDTDDTSTAVNVWRWNLNGLAHSHSGYNGPFDDIAITQDGKINASMITTGVINANLITAGTLSADRISGGTIDASDVTITNLNASNITSGTMSANKISGGILSLGGQNNTNGQLYIYDANGVLCGKIDNTGIEEYGEVGGYTQRLSIGAGYLTLSYAGFTLGVLNAGSSGGTYGGTLSLLGSSGHTRAYLSAVSGALYLNDAQGNSGIELNGASGIAWIRGLGANAGRGSLSIYGSQQTGYDGNGTPIYVDSAGHRYQYFVDSSGHIATDLGHDTTRSFLTLNSPDGSSNIFLDTLPANGSRFNSPTTFNAAVTMNSTIDVTQRRCYANLSSEGWYRVLVFNGTSANDANGNAGAQIDITIIRDNGVDRPENHNISFHLVAGNIKFDNEHSVSTAMLIDKIRYSRDGNYGYIDVYYNLASTNNVTIDYIVHDAPTRQNLYTSGGLSSAPAGGTGTVLTTYSFSPNETNKTVLLSAQTINSGYFIYTDSMITTGSKIQITQAYNYGETIGLFYTAQPRSGDVVVYCRTNSGANPTDGSKTSVFLTIDNR